MVVKSISLMHPFPDTCGWNQAMEYESGWHLQQALKDNQSAAGCAYHFVATFIYNLPLINYTCYLITYVALAAIRPDWLEKAEGAKRIHFEKRGAIETADIEAQRPKDTVRSDYHAKMYQIFGRQEKKNVLLVGPPDVGKTKIAETFPGEIFLIDHFEKIEYVRLASLFKKHHGHLILCARRPIPHEELVLRYCTPIEVKEPSDVVTKQIVKGRFPKATDEVLDQALELCRFYLPNQCQPGLLFDVIDGTSSIYREINIENVREHLSQKIMIPIRLPAERDAYYATAKSILKEKVLGQNHVTLEIARILENCGKGYWPTGVPIFHFAGPTGVGKTELAKAMGTFFYQSDKRFLHVSMAQYREAHSVSALTGTTPGYIGFEMGGQIQEKAKEGPFVLLLDEADKAHSDVITNLIQHVAEEGTLYDPKTQSNISLKGCIIVLTSNLGTSELDASEHWWKKPDLSNPEEVEAIIKPVMERHFRADLIARFRTFYFTPHTDEDVVKRIVIKFLDKEQTVHPCTLTWTDEYVDAFTNMEKIKKVGVRWIRDSIEGTLRHQILRGNYRAEQTIQIHWNGSKDIIRLVEE